MELLEHVRNGNMDSLEPWRLSGPRELLEEEFIGLVKMAVQHGHVNILKKCVSEEDLENNACDVVFTICMHSAKHNQISILEYVVGVLGLEFLGAEYDRTICEYAVQYGQLEVFKWWMVVRQSNRKEYKPYRVGKNEINNAVHYGQPLILSWLLENGYTTDKKGNQIVIKDTFHKKISKENRAQILSILHAHGMQGLFRKDCESGKCVACRAEKVWDIWVLNDQEFVESVQWLPKEMMEDVLTFCI
jgi:hypothetical protein